MTSGSLHATFRDNSQSPRLLSGIDSLFHTFAAPGFDSFDPENPRASAGLNFEHVISGHRSRHNAFSPRKGRYDLFRLPDRTAVRLVRRAEDDPWALSSDFTYVMRPPHAIDFEFRCRARNASLFGQRRYAVLFFANYMNDVAELPIHFKGVSGPDEAEAWLRSDAPPGHAHYDHGGTFRSLDASPLAWDADHNFTLNLWSYEYPRFTQPFYYGRAAHGMVFLLMFDRQWSPRDEIRFSLFKHKTLHRPRPAWDFQYVVHGLEEDQLYGFRGRLIWKKFVSPDDCEMEYQLWRRSLPAGP